MVRRRHASSLRRFTAGLRRRWLVPMSAGILLVSLLAAPPSASAAPGQAGPELPKTTSVPVTGVRGTSVPQAQSATVPRFKAGSPKWPAGGTAALAVDTGNAGAGRSAIAGQAGGAGKAGGLPVRLRKQGLSPSDAQADPKAEARLQAVQGPSAVRLSVADRAVTDKAKVQGVLFTLVRGDGGTGTGKVAVDVDYSGFATAYGADYGSRLRLVQLPGCVLTTPEKSECQVQTPVEGAVNSAAAQVVSYDVADVAAGSGSVFAATGAADAAVAAGGKAGSTDVQPGAMSAGGSTKGSSPVVKAAGQVVYALTAGPSGPGGNYTSTSLSETSSWAAGTQGGELTYRVPIAVPPGLGGPVPDIALSYSSGSVDGRTVAKNSQASWVGEGWDYSPGYIEQSYRSCKDDGWTNADLCVFENRVFTMSFGGRSGRLVLQDGPNGRWHLESDDGSRIEQISDTSKGNGDTQGRYWKLTAQDGTQYYFGVNKRYTGDTQSTNSTQNTLVYSNHSWEPCYNATHDYWSGCDMTYRWNLDYVVDPRGNSMTYFYNRYQGKYGNWNGTDTHVYDITSTLDRIEYGTRAGSEASTTAPMRVVFGTGVRCLETVCENHPENWPDTPWDQHCPVTATSCASNQSPTYWTPFRLTTITTQIYELRASTPENPLPVWWTADIWTLSHTFPDPVQEDVSPSLWFDFLNHNGWNDWNNETITTPQMHFGGQTYANLVSATTPRYGRYRLTRIESGAGHVTTANYSAEECTPTNVGQNPWDQQPRRCYPQWNGTSYSWYHKYVVTDVTDWDTLTGASPERTAYTYDWDGSSTNVLWHYASDESAIDAHRSWTDFAGYSMVTTTRGPVGGQQSISKTLYYRGMNGDRISSGSRSVTVTDSTGTVVTDSVGLRGTVREQRVMDGTAIVQRTIHTPWTSVTGTRTATWNLGTINSQYIRNAQTDVGTWLPVSSTWRTARTTWTYNTDGLEVTVKEHGDIAITGDETCRTTGYADPNTTLWYINYPVQTLTTNCAAVPTGTDFLAGGQTFYDGATRVGAPPTKGLVTKTNRLASVSGGSQTWAQASRAAYDVRGRVTDAYDALDKHTITNYNPVDGPVRSINTTNPLGHITTTGYNPLRGEVTSTTDPNGKRTSLNYDPLGRLTRVYLPHGTITDYTTSTATQTFTDIRSTGTAVALTGDNANAQINLPFAFKFYGQSYATASLSTNGLLSFAGANPDSTTAALPSTAPPNAAIYPFWDNLELDASSAVATKATGTAPNRQFTIEWYNALLSGRSTRVTFTVTLHENGAIVFNYNDVNTNGHDQGSAATVGIENSAGTAGTQFSRNQTQLATNKAITFTPVTAPTTTLPDIEYTYTLSNTATVPNVVTTKVLGPNGNQITSYTLYDGRMRLRQTQAPASQALGGRVINDTQYDGRGLILSTASFWNNSAPGTAVAGYTDASVPIQHRYTYDNLGRQTIDGLWAQNALKWQTETVYQGDRTATIPPTGGPTTQKLTDARGNTTELRQFTGTNLGGTFTKTTYAYDRLNRLTSTTDQAGNVWSTAYDLRGRPYSSTDPDKGTTLSTFDNAGRLTTVTNARNISLTYAYDDLGRKTALHDGTTTAGFKRAAWSYDTLAKGLPTSSTRYVGTDSFTTSVTGYDDRYQLLGSTTVIPSSLDVPGLPAGSYTTTNTYNIDGSVATTTYPAAADLPAETITTTYDNTGRSLTMSSPATTYVQGTSYYWHGALYQQFLGSGTKRIKRTTTVEEFSGRLNTDHVEIQNQTNTANWDLALKEQYGYDAAGNVKNIRELNAAGATVSNQCFNYDTLRELTEAWTTTSGTCQASPSTGVVGGPDPYWTSYSYDTATSNRTAELRHAVTGGTDTTRTYAYTTTGKPHALSTVTATGGGTGTDTYQYDAAGNTTTRSITGKPGQALTWDNEGHLATVTDTAGPTSYIYDADGNRIVSKDPAGVTVYLGAFELRKVGSTTTCTRYVGPSTRTAAGISWVIADHHGTGQLAVDGTTLAVTRRKTDPFGNPRGTDPTWPNPHGFVNGIRDNTGLTHLGAREYEPGTGRFISDDPITDPADPQQSNGYSYANNSPVTSSDPTGFWTDHDPGDYKPAPCSNPTMCDHQDLPGGGSNPKKDPCANPGAKGNPCDTRYDEPDEQERQQQLIDEALQLNAEFLAHEHKVEAWAIAGCEAMEADNHCEFNGAEIQWCIQYGAEACKNAALTAFAARGRAEALAKELGWDDGQRNAFRHAYWFALLTNKYQVDMHAALVLGAAHEVDDTRATQKVGTVNSKIDMWNNFSGVIIGRTSPAYPSGQCNSCEKALENRVIAAMLLDSGATWALNTQGD
ncbi:RHS repeat-associated core domain-containing protein [Dactylosporangium sp. AC04546]|uniref:RHS repeat-associated core domain-containing protein n=1 Tax=Dactylosporangium sp. AC04546 TaxID=2862460 RepID=UPI002E7BE81E|nr:RHS repeat-associated core domain-containing protein [Dactylosporangium sp. AC04546]WVK79364.1 RHS repeat-associated core domain-containing protein [Dactylosporangium sp. AC04546]